ncbi:MAG: hypothetical protein WD874_00370 [Parcubacteria group bacterium]
MITIEEFKKTEITIGEILKVEEVERSDKLLKLTVNFGLKRSEDRPPEPEALGEDIRTVVSGIRKYFGDPQELVGVKCAFVTNLEPRPLMGLVSEGMIMAASTDEAFSLLRVSEDIPAGTRIK